MAWTSADVSCSTVSMAYHIDEPETHQNEYLLNFALYKPRKRFGAGAGATSFYLTKSRIRSRIKMMRFHNSNLQSNTNIYEYEFKVLFNGMYEDMSPL
jgi:hypothetical protein